MELVPPLPNLDPVARKLIDATLEHFNLQNISQFQLEKILRATNVTKGSFYLHFGSEADLLNTALIEKFVEILAPLFQDMHAGLTRANSPEEVVSVLEDVVRRQSGTSTRELRAYRLEVMSRATKSHINSEQYSAFFEWSIQQWQLGIEICQERGWCKRDLSSRATAVLLVGTSVSRVVDDLAVQHVETEDWLASLLQLYLSVFLGAFNR